MCNIRSWYRLILKIFIFLNVEKVDGGNICENSILYDDFDTKDANCQRTENAKKNAVFSFHGPNLWFIVPVVII